jgi:hypothetical protein
MRPSKKGDIHDRNLSMGGVKISRIDGGIRSRCSGASLQRAGWVAVATSLGNRCSVSPGSSGRWGCSESLWDPVPDIHVLASVAAGAGNSGETGPKNEFGVGLAGLDTDLRSLE